MHRSTEWMATLAAGALALSASAWAQLGIRIPGGDASGFDQLAAGSLLSTWRRLEPDSDARQPLVYSQVVETASQLGAQRSTAIYQPLSQRLSSLVETSYAEMGDLGGEWSVLGQVGATLAPGWGVQAGLRHSETGLTPGVLQPYATRAGTAQLGMLTVEHNWRSLRGAYTLFGTYADSGAAGTGQRFELQYYYSERSSVGLSFTAGHPLQTPTALTTYAPFEGNNLGLTGEHWLSSTWAVNYRALVQDPSFASGLKPLIRVGLRYAF
jgi:hypothetical protein